MIELIIDKKVVKMPSRSNEVSLNTGVQILELVKDLKNPTTNDKITIISTLASIEPELLYNVKEDSINKIYDAIDFIHLNETYFLFDSFILDRVLYGKISLDEMTVLEYADIEYYFAQSDYILTNLDKVISIMYRPIISKKSTFKQKGFNLLNKILFKRFIPQQFESYEVEKYSKTHEKFLDRLDLNNALSIFNLVIKNKQTLTDEFPVIFNVQKKEEVDLDQYDAPNPDVKPPKSLEQIWATYHLVATISSGLFERDAWYKKNIREFFTYLSYRNDSINEENMKIRYQNNK